MSSCTQRVAALALLTAAALPAFAESSVASSASDSVSRSMAGISDSLTNSSAGSSNHNNNQALGDYKVIDVAEVAGKPDMVRLRLQHVAMPATTQTVAAADADAAGAGIATDLLLTLPRAAADDGQVTSGAVITALQRPYGVEFATGATHQAFFLALADDWAREMKTSPLSL